MSNEFERLEREDVISVYSGQILVTNRTFTVNEIIAALMPIVKEKSGNIWTEDKEQWFREGLDCKMLKPGAKSWQRGKVRLTLEFTPEDLEVKESSENGQLEGTKASSPLDDIRQMMPKDT
jgi:antitoxin component YwqK of YwqJK toxin-antitoxin module